MESRREPETVRPTRDPTTGSDQDCDLGPETVPPLLEIFRLECRRDKDHDVRPLS